jgi:mRNA interferase RelE/StbE
LKYEARLSRRASKELDSLEKSIQKRILQKLEELQENPFPHGATKLQGMRGIWRVRVGDYRILYEVFSQEGLLLIDKIDHRSRAYG